MAIRNLQDAHRIENKWRGSYEGKKRYALMAHAMGASDQRTAHLQSDLAQMEAQMSGQNQPLTQVSEMQQVRLMLEALLSTSPQSLTSWVGGWVGGASSEGVPYVILYPDPDNTFLNNYTVKVYQEDFWRLPNFIPTKNLPNDTDSSPQKNAAIKRGILHPCPPFKVIMTLGAETDNGNRRKRLLGVLKYGKPKTQAPPPQKQAPPKRDTLDDWFSVAQSAQTTQEFDAAISQAEPFYGSAANVATFRGYIFEGYDPKKAAVYARAMKTYAECREGGSGHAAAKMVAINLIAPQQAPLFDGAETAVSTNNYQEA